MTAGTLRRTAATAATIGVAATLAAAPGAQAQSNTSADVASGQTMLRLAPATARVLTANGVRVSPISPARNAASGLTFPVAPSGSSLDPRSYAGTLNHTGGLRFRAGGKTLNLTRFQVKVGSRSTLSALVNGRSRATIISLNTRAARITRSGIDTGVSNITASLTATGASALNSFFDVRLFRPGLRLGTVRSEAKFGEIIITGGQTEVALDSGTLTALAGLGVTPGIVAPGTLVGTTASYPITGGRVNARTLAGSVTHSGGISLTAGATRVELTNFDVQLPKLLLQVNGGTAVPAVDVDASNVRVQITGRNVTVTNMTAKLSPLGASALSSAFGTTIPAATLGGVTVRAQAR